MDSLFNDAWMIEPIKSMSEMEWRIGEFQIQIIAEDCAQKVYISSLQQNVKQHQLGRLYNTSRKDASSLQR